MEMIPLISGFKAGPLGIVHLPRLWFKVRARAVEALPSEYRAGSGGTDGQLLGTFGIDADAFAGYLASDVPDYQACERWIAAHARDTSPATIATYNDEVDASEMHEPRRTEWAERFGITDGAYVSALSFNQLDDWDAIHRELFDDNARPTPLVPAISSSTVGPLGVPHLPRLWLKHRLHIAGRLIDGYRHGAGGFDEMLTVAIGLDPLAFMAFVETEKPDYMAAEAYVRQHATALTAETIAAWSAKINGWNFPDERIPERHAELDISDANFKHAISLNDLDDWLMLHRQLLAIR